MFSTSTSAVEIVAHRGASFDAPENTLASMNLAWEQGANAIELDLWLSKDGRLVVFHDSDTKRFDSQPRRVSDLNWEELQKLDVGAWKAPKFTGERIPSLEAVLATIPEDGRAVLEIKSGPEILTELARVIHETRTPAKQLCIINFDFEALKQSKRLLPEIDHYLLSGYKKDPVAKKFPDLAFLIQRAKDAHFTGLDLQFTWPIDSPFVSEIKRAGLSLMVWTIDDPEVAQKLADAGVDSITTNRPALLRSQLKPRFTAN